jgi:5-methylcytosine-specific restriction endonuclease McrA
MKKYCKEYADKYRILHPHCSLISMNKKRFGGLREKVLKRDGYKCVMCGMTREQHYSAWDRDLTIDHIDHCGRYNDIQNNEMDNLQTLCLRCHGAKDAIQHGKYSVYLANLNRERLVNNYDRFR